MPCRAVLHSQGLKASASPAPSRQPRARPLLPWEACQPAVQSPGHNSQTGEPSVGWSPRPPSLWGPCVLTPRFRLQVAGSFQRRLYKLGVHDRALLGREGRGGVDPGNPGHSIPGPQPRETRSVGLGKVPATFVFRSFC